MKKKLISTLLCVSMVAAMVAGCGSGDDTKDANNDASNTEGTYLVLSQQRLYLFYSMQCFPSMDQLHRLYVIWESFHRNLTL